MIKAIFFSEGVVQVFIGIGALISGLLLVIAPDGSFFQMSVDTLANSPFHDFLIPGLILMTVNGLGSLAGAVFSFKRHALAGYAGMVFGFGLMIWIFVQVNLIGGGHWLQYLYFSLGVLETVLAILMHEVILDDERMKPFLRW